ncbi:hypothetical protein D3C87_637160 [compost metagenome]
MIEFTGKHILTDQQLLIMKLTLPHFNVNYYVNSFREYSHTDKYGYKCRKSHTFLGFMEDRSSRFIGFSYENQRFVAVHRFYQNWDWGDGGELDYDPETRPWILFFQGCDDSSFYMRFAKEAELDQEWETLSYFYDHSELLYCN